VQVLSLIRPPCVFSIQAKLVMHLFDYSAGYACHVPALEALMNLILQSMFSLFYVKNKSSSLSGGQLRLWSNAKFE